MLLDDASKSSKKENTNENTKEIQSLSGANFKWLYLGLGLNVLGYLLMIGGGSDDPSKFNEAELFSVTRITIAPMIIIGSYIIMIYSIMKRPTKKEA
jgi:Protein of unknown function (DUF3098)